MGQTRRQQQVLVAGVARNGGAGAIAMARGTRVRVCGRRMRWRTRPQVLRLLLL